MSQVFLSYSSEDNVSMGRILNDLQAAKLSTTKLKTRDQPGVFRVLEAN